MLSSVSEYLPPGLMVLCELLGPTAPQSSLAHGLVWDVGGCGNASFCKLLAGFLELTSAEVSPVTANLIPGLPSLRARHLLELL